MVSQENLWINEQKGKGNGIPSFPYVHFADYVVDHKVDFVEVAKSLGESKKDLIGCGAIGHQGVHASGPVAFLMNENSPGVFVPLTASKYASCQSVERPWLRPPTSVCTVPRQFLLCFFLLEATAVDGFRHNYI